MSQGAIINFVNKLGGLSNDTGNQADDFNLISDCLLNQLFGFASKLRTVSQGNDEFTMESKEYQPASP